MTFEFEDHTESFLEVTHDEAKAIGLFVAAFGFFIFIAGMVASTVLVNGHWPQDASPFRLEEDGGIFFPMVFFLIFSIRAPRSFVPIFVMSVGIMYAMQLAYESNWHGFLHSDLAANLKVGGAYFGSLTVAFACLYPYPHKVGLGLVYVFGTYALLSYVAAWASPAGQVVQGNTWVGCGIGVLISLYGSMVLSHLHSLQHDIEARHFIRHGD